MNSSSLDSSHCPPEAVPAGNWRSASETNCGSGPATVVLPPKRTTAFTPEQRLHVQKYNRGVVRLEPETPALKVERHIAFHERPKREKNPKNSTGEDQNWGLSQRHSMRWLASAGAGIIALVVLIMILLPLINAPNAPRAQTANKALEAEDVTKVEDSVMLNQVLTKQPEAMQMFRAYSQAALVHNIVPLIRNGEALKETLHHYWHPLGISTDWTPSPESTWTVFEAAGHACGLLQGVFPNGSKFAAYFTNDNNRLLLDWKATSSFGTATFEQLAKNEGDASEIRGQISVADFYSATWPEAEYQSYRLISPDEKTVIWCYARRGSSAEHIATSLFQGGEIVQEAQDTRNISLKLERGPSSALPNQWLIGQVLQVDSITP